MVVREVSYNGYLFRSKAEAKWAFFLDTIGVDYLYESDTFTLTSASGKQVNYFPDFFITDLNCFLEVKLEKTPLVEECWKCSQLAKETGMDVVLAFQELGRKDYNAYHYTGGTGEVQNGFKLTTCPFCSRFDFTKNGLCGGMKCECSNRCANLPNDRSIKLKTAMDATRKHRFRA